MLFSAEKALLQDAIFTVMRAVSTKSTLPALEGILFEVSEGEVVLSGYNLETGICTRLDAAVKNEGSIVIPARLLGDIIRKLPDSMVTVESDEKFMVNIRCGMSEFNILGTTPDDFPEMPQVVRDNSLTLAGETLSRMINETIFAVSTNENRPIHTGSLFEVESDFLNVVSVDGYRLAVSKKEVKNVNGEGLSFVVPASALREVMRIAEDSGGDTVIDLGGRHVLFTMGNTTLVCRLLDGEFLNYRSSLEQKRNLSLKVDRRTLLDCVDRVSLVASERIKSPVKIEAGGGAIKLLCTAALGRAYDECPAEGEGDVIEIGFNNRYLIEALRAIPDDELIIDLSSPLHPCIMRPVEGDEWIHLILPVRLKA